MDSSAPNPQPISLELADIQFLETQIYDQRTRTHDQETQTHDQETQTYNQQRAAALALPLEEVLGSLKDEEDRDIFAWLKLARSVRPKPEGNLACLTVAQIRAISMMRYCNAERVNGVLRDVRTSSAVSASHPILDPALDSELEWSSILSDASLSSLTVAPPHGGAHQQILTRGPAATVPLVQEEYKYYCTYCDFPNNYKFYWQWRNHERDHVLNYICMLNGATEDTPQGSECVFCGELNPSEGHLSTHNVEICRPGSSGPFSCKTTQGMVDHLHQAHHVDNSRTLTRLVSTLEESVNKQAWSCGFCVISLADFEQRLNHIALHFQKGQTIDQWDINKVIRGLLHQPGVIKAWKEQMASHPEGQSEFRYWKQGRIKALRRDLEVGPNSKKTARDLAEAAFAASEVNVDKWAETLNLTDFDTMLLDFYEDHGKA